MLCTGKWTKILENHGMNPRFSKTMYNIAKDVLIFELYLVREFLYLERKLMENILVLSNKSIFTSVWSNAG